MEVHFTPEVEAKIEQMAHDSGSRSEDLVKDVLTGFFEEVAFTRQMIDRRYDDLESGRVKLVPASEVFAKISARSAARRAARR